MKKLVLVFILLFMAGGCVMAPTHITQTDPSHLRVWIFNSSSFYVKMEGPVKGWMDPYSSVTLNTKCAGTFKGVGHAYKKIGETTEGKNALFYMGEQTFSVRTDGRNSMHNGESYDAVITLSSFRKYGNVIGEKTHVFYTNPCSLIFPDLEFRWGK